MNSLGHTTCLPKACGNLKDTIDDYRISLLMKVMITKSKTDNILPALVMIG